ncbi:MAG: DNA polymerase III subunit gamma/tau [Clostridia bacterium]|nr:DNA polymerase III subunit gamma/tau [Clostridia bacterium]
MAYLALYRMFRPATLKDVVRQEHIVTILKNQIETGKIGHAYLFCGPRGTGKTSVAKIFAAAINCESPKEGSPCGECAVCKALKDPANLDISEIDAASNNGVDEMRDLREKVQYPPVAGKYKVYIVDEVHMLSTGAFNALLKTLEEPPAHAVFILATTEAQKIPATILSRCMRFDFKLIAQEDLEERLRFVLKTIGKDYEEEAVAAIARAGAGSVRDMLSVADTCVSYSSGKLTAKDVAAVLGSADFAAVGKLCGALLKGDVGCAIAETEKILGEGKSVGTLLKDVMNYLNAVTVAKTCRDAERILSLPKEVFAAVKEEAEKADGHTLLRVTEIFAKAENDSRYAASPKIVFETAVLKAGLPEEDRDPAALMSRIAILERKIKEGVVAQSEVSASPTPEKAEKKPAQQSMQEPTGGYDYAAYDVPPPDEEATGGNVYFDAGFAPAEEKPAPKRESVAAAAGDIAAPIASNADKAEGEAPTVKPMPRAAAGDAKVTFGSFLRALRKTGKNGVLFTICMDLENFYEGETFVLSTTSETIFRSLKREEHYALITQAFSLIGVTAFDVRLKNKPKDEFDKNLAELKERFPDVKVEVK